MVTLDAQSEMTWLSSKHSCVKVISVRRSSAAQVTHWEPASGQFFLVPARKMGQFLIRKHRACSLKLWNNLAPCSQQWKKMQTSHKPLQWQKNKKFNELEGTEREEGTASSSVSWF